MDKSIRRYVKKVLLAAVLVSVAISTGFATASGVAAQLGPRPFFLVDGMDESDLQRRLAACNSGPFSRSDFSIGHRGAPLLFPEHTRESYEAAARQGAGIIECDVTFTRDRALVCRHSQCDLHTTTNILLIPELAAKCTQPFTPFDGSNDASARCCTSDITLKEFKTLRGKMDAANKKAKTAAAYVSENATANWRSDLYSGRGTLMTHAESIELFRQLGVKMTPELKTPSVAMPYQGDFTRQAYAQKMIDEYKSAGVDAGDVWAQSFRLEDVRFWINNEPDFGRQAVFLDDRVYNDAGFKPSRADFERLKRQGVNIVAPPMWALLELSADGRIIASAYATLARAAGLDIITWTLERSDLRKGGLNGRGQPTWYYQTTADAIKKDSDMYEALDVLARDVRVIGIFSDWPATVTYYANCMGLH